MSKVFHQGTGAAGPCPYECVMQDDITEIKGDVKLLIAYRNQEIGAKSVKTPSPAKWISIGVAVTAAATGLLSLAIN